MLTLNTITYFCLRVLKIYAFRYVRMLIISSILSRIRSRLISFRPVYSFLRASAPLHKRNERRVSIDFLYFYVTSFSRWTRSTTLIFRYHPSGENMRVSLRRYILRIHLVDLAVCLSYVRFILIVRASVKSLRIRPFFYARAVHRQFLFYDPRHVGRDRSGSVASIGR